MPSHNPISLRESTPLVDISLQVLGLLFLAAFFAGFIDSIAGGGGLITVPAMLLAGLPPLETLGTNKAQSLFGSGSATLAYAAKGHVKLKEQLPMAVMSGLGAILGATVTTYLPTEILQAFLPLLLVVVAAYFALKPTMGDVDSHARIKPFVFGLTFVPAIGFYDGIFGPGTGSFFMLAFVTMAGFGILKATAHTKLLNFSSNIGAFLVFIVSGVIVWKVAIAMAIGQILGAQTGARFAMRNGAKIIRPLLIVTCLALAVKLLSDPANPLRLWLNI